MFLYLLQEHTVVIEQYRYKHSALSLSHMRVKKDYVKGTLMAEVWGVLLVWREK